MATMIINKVERLDNGNYNVHYREGEDAVRVVEYTHEAYDHMCNFLKQAKTATGGAIEDYSLTKEEAKVLAMENKLEQTREGLVRMIQQDRKLAQEESVHLKQLIAGVESRKSSIFEEVNGQTAKRITGLRQTLENIKKMEEISLSRLNSREEKIDAIVRDLNNKSEISWESVKQVRDEIKASKKDVENFRNATNKDMENLKGEQVAALEGINTFFKETDKKVDAFVVEQSGVIKELQKQYTTRIAEREARIKKEELDTLRKEYLDRELERREKADNEKREYLKEQTAKITTKVEAEITRLNTLKKVNLATMANKIRKVETMVARDPSVLEEEAKRLGELEKVYTDRANAEAQQVKQRRAQKIGRVSIAVNKAVTFLMRGEKKEQ